VSTTRSPTDLAKPAAIGDYAGRRALARLRSRKIATRETRVLLEAPLASGLLGHFVGAVSGGSLYRKASFLLDSLGTQVFSPIVNIREEPHRPRGQASTCFDDDGVLTRPRDVVRDGGRVARVGVARDEADPYRSGPHRHRAGGRPRQQRGLVAAVGRRDRADREPPDHSARVVEEVRRRQARCPIRATRSKSPEYLREPRHLPAS